MKKIMLLIAGIVLLLALSPTVALAGPPNPPNYGVVDPVGISPGLWGDEEKIIPAPSAPGGQIHIVTDPLVGGGAASGWVTFWCQSTVGFQYNIGTTGLNPLSRYSVHAFGIQAIIVPPGTPGAIDTGEGFWILIVGGVDLDLGTFKTDANGLGGVKGVAQLPSVYVYNVGTVVFDGDGVPVLWSPFDDPNAFIVY